jgi:hypothetical protein
MRFAGASATIQSAVDSAAVIFRAKTVSTGNGGTLTISSGGSSDAAGKGGNLSFTGGATSNVASTLAGGNVTFNAGNASGTGVGGTYQAVGGNGDRGGPCNISGGTGLGTTAGVSNGGLFQGKGGAASAGNGGAASLLGGATTTGTGGLVTVKGGASSSSGTGGSIVVAPGASTSGTAGTVSIQDASLNNLIQVGPTVNTIGFFGAAPIAIPTVTGAKVDLTATGALASLLTQLATLGLIIDSST